jgi:hypothetical protein
MKDILKQLASAAGPGHYAYQFNSDRPYLYFEDPITDEMIDAHLSGEKPLGMNVVREGTTARVLVFDIDDHEGTVDPAVMLSRAGAIAGALVALKVPFFVVRSGGGRGSRPRARSRPRERRSRTVWPATSRAALTTRFRPMAKGSACSMTWQLRSACCNARAVFAGHW